MPYSVAFAPEIEKNAQVVIPISLNNPSFNEESIPAMLTAVLALGAQVTVLIADYLSRHNMSEAKAMERGDAIAHQYAGAFDHPAITVVRWKDWIALRQAAFERSLKQTKALYDEGGAFKKSVLRTAKQCKSTTSQAASVNYQLEEYAALACKQEYDFLLYPAYISHGMFATYEAFAIKRPAYVHVRLKKQKVNAAAQSAFFDNSPGQTVTVPKKNSDYIPVTMRCIIENCETILTSPEISPKQKQWLAETMKHMAGLYLLNSGIFTDQRELPGESALQMEDSETYQGTNSYP